jgi:hypothetical protein
MSFFAMLRHILIEQVCRLLGHQWHTAELSPTFRYCIRCSTCGWATTQ